MGKGPKPMELLVLMSELHLKNRQVIKRIGQRLRRVATVVVVVVGVADAAAAVADSMNWMPAGADNPIVASVAFANRASAFWVRHHEAVVTRRNEL